MADNYYAIVHKKNGSLLVMGSTLPVYWNKKVANEVVRGWPNHEVKPIAIDKLNELLKSNNPH